VSVVHTAQLLKNLEMVYVKNLRIESQEEQVSICMKSFREKNKKSHLKKTPCNQLWRYYIIWQTHCQLDSSLN
jgi:hypothetical protein